MSGIASKRKNASINFRWMSGKFKSYNLLSRLLKSPPKFVSRIINTPEELSLTLIAKTSDTLGVNEDVIFGDLIRFKIEVTDWILKQQKRVTKDKNKRRRRAVGMFKGHSERLLINSELKASKQPTTK